MVDSISFLWQTSEAHSPSSSILTCYINHAEMQSAQRLHNGDIFVFRGTPTRVSTTHMPLESTMTRPNPLEPTAAINPHYPPIDELNVSTGQEWRWLLQPDHHTGLRPQPEANKRRIVDDNHAIALPKPPVRSVQRRPRLPPTLSGLHQPPPNAGLLPSISIEKAVNSTSSDANAEPEHRAVERPADAQVPGQPRTKRWGTRNKWSDQETKDLLHGVARFGIGSWTAILKCPDYHFASRTALDLKDRFRVCRPGDYGRVVKQNPLRRRCNERLSASDLKSIGMDTPFERVARRKRHTYTDAEDERLLKGLEKHGRHWARIQQDQELDLAHRTRADIRDRLRTKFPDLLRQHQRPAKPSSTARAPNFDTSPTHRTRNAPEIARQHVNESPKSSGQTARQAATDKQPLLPLLDPLWSFDFEELDFNGSSITLDRDILNWPMERSASTTFQPGLPSMITNEQPAEAWSTMPMLSDAGVNLSGNNFHIPNLSNLPFG